MGGTMDKISGAANVVAGKAKQVAGDVVDSPKMQAEGAMQEAKGRAENAVGDAKNAASESGVADKVKGAANVVAGKAKQVAGDIALPGARFAADLGKPGAKRSGIVSRARCRWVEIVLGRLVHRAHCGCFRRRASSEFGYCVARVLAYCWRNCASPCGLLSIRMPSHRLCAVARLRL